MTNKFQCLVVLGLTVAGGSFAKPIAKCDVLPKPTNVVAQPPYVTDVPCPEGRISEEKPQYRGARESKPSFADKETEAREENGAFYDLGTELYVGPEPMITETFQPILEDDAEATGPNPKP